MQAKLEFGRVEVVVATISTIHALASVAELVVLIVDMTVGAVAVVGTVVLGESSAVSKSSMVGVVGHTRVAVTVSVVNASGIVSVEQAGDASVSVVLWVVFACVLKALLSMFVEVVVVMMVVVVMVIVVGVGSAEIAVSALSTSTTSTASIVSAAGLTEVSFPPFEGILLILLLLSQAPALVPVDVWSVIPAESP